MQELEAIKVLVVDYRTLVGNGISTILRHYSDFQVIGQTKTREETLRLIERNSLDILCMDIELPDPASGMEVIRKLRQKRPQTRIIILTNYLDETIIRDSLRAGVTSYLLKNVSTDHLVYAIRATFQGMTTLSPEITQLLIREVTAPNGYHLTPREHEVLALLVQGWNNHDIAKELNISLSTVQFHISNILEKLAVHNRIEAATFAIRHNLAAYQKPWSAAEH